MLFNDFEMLFYVFEMLLNDFEMLFNEFELLFNDFERFFNDLSNSLINLVRSRDPVGEKTTKIGTYEGGAAAEGRRSNFCGLLSDRVS